ncbi:hypothetical protein MTR_0373s0020 [Medicago truncatula]|uniref:Uncharacterized protein n=1 Tax=Medicago truncatula TaxID=3880 RepID=A0A072TFM8_MEDTR|nr:hypothetical protein MTR_0373s0020 [Medicago truncatula]
MCCKNIQDPEGQGAQQVPLPVQEGCADPSAENYDPTARKLVTIFGSFLYRVGTYKISLIPSQCFLHLEITIRRLVIDLVYTSSSSVYVHGYDPPCVISTSLAFVCKASDAFPGPNSPLQSGYCLIQDTVFKRDITA